MKSFLVLSIFCAFLVGCQATRDEEPPTQPSKSESTLSIGTIDNKQFLTDLLGNKGLVRGFNFGMPIDSILQNESLELFEERPSHVGFTFEKETLESADILYMRDSQNKLIGIDIDVYLNSEASAEAMFATAKGHYNSLYTKSKTDSLTWQITPKGYVKIKQVKTPLDNGLEIKYRK